MGKENGIVEAPITVQFMDDSPLLLEKLIAGESEVLPCQEVNRWSTAGGTPVGRWLVGSLGAIGGSPELLGNLNTGIEVAASVIP